jgi:hypothetical protein
MGELLALLELGRIMTCNRLALDRNRGSCYGHAKLI